MFHMKPLRPGARNQGRGGETRLPPSLKLRPPRTLGGPAAVYVSRETIDSSGPAHRGQTQSNATTTDRRGSRPSEYDLTPSTAEIASCTTLRSAAFIGSSMISPPSSST